MKDFREQMITYGDKMNERKLCERNNLIYEIKQLLCEIEVRSGELDLLLANAETGMEEGLLTRHTFYASKVSHELGFEYIDGQLSLVLLGGGANGNVAIVYQNGKARAYDVDCTYVHTLDVIDEKTLNRIKSHATYFINGIDPLIKEFEEHIETKLAEVE